MAEVNHVEMFNCTPEELYAILVDYEKYHEFLKDVKSCKVIGESGGKKLVEYKVSVMKEITYVNEHTENAPHEISWVFKKGDLFKSMSGGWKLENINGKTKANYRVQAEFGMFVPGMITKTLLSVNLPLMMQAYKKRVKEIYGK